MNAHLLRRPSKNAPVVVVGAGQSGLAAARVLHQLNVPVMVLEAGDRPAGSWPHSYDSLRLFSPAGFSSMPGMPFPVDPYRHPARDEVADYLERYTAALPVEIQTKTRVLGVHEANRGFVVITADGRELAAAGMVAATGSFSKPHRPSFPGQSTFTGEPWACSRRPVTPAVVRLQHAARSERRRRRRGVAPGGMGSQCARSGRGQQVRNCSIDPCQLDR